MPVVKKGEVIGIEAQLVVEEIIEHNHHMYYLGKIVPELDRPSRDLNIIPTFIFALDPEVQTIPEAVAAHAQHLLEKRFES